MKRPHELQRQWNRIGEVVGLGILGTDVAMIDALSSKPLRQGRAALVTDVVGAECEDGGYGPVSEAPLLMTSASSRSPQ